MAASGRRKPRRCWPPSTCGSRTGGDTDVLLKLALIKPAPELETVNGLLTNAFQMALQAADIRTRAIGANDMTLAWQASSAAAGAMLFLDQAREQLQKLLTPPVQ